jgi:hypothetical protein
VKPQAFFGVLAIPERCASGHRKEDSMRRLKDQAATVWAIAKLVVLIAVDLLRPPHLSNRAPRRA